RSRRDRGQAHQLRLLPARRRPLPRTAGARRRRLHGRPQRQGDREAGRTSLSATDAETRAAPCLHHRARPLLHRAAADRARRERELEVRELAEGRFVPQVRRHPDRGQHRRDGARLREHDAQRLRGGVVNSLTATLGVLSAMITPAVLILASGSLILTTSSRLIRAVDRVREILPLMEQLAPNDASRRAMLMNQLAKTTMRARMLQHTLSLLYTAIGLFVATSVSIGVIALLSLQLAWIPLL